jgi:hypothetical protein
MNTSHKTLLVCTTLLTAGLTYCGAAECYENTAPIWIAMTFMGGFMSAVVLSLILDEPN